MTSHIWPADSVVHIYNLANFRFPDLITFEGLPLLPFVALLLFLCMVFFGVASFNCVEVRTVEER